MHLKRTVRGARRVLRGRSGALARQEARALLLAHNVIAGLAAAATASLSPGQICFTAVLSLARAEITAGTCCPHCGKRSASENTPTVGPDAVILALLPGRADRQRTSGRTAADRRKWTSAPAEYTLTVTPSNLLKDVSFGS